ncbi:MAG: LrgB family protein, partial [Anderseniella sp.]
MSDLKDIWVYLSASPLLYLTMTLVAFQVASAIYEKMNKNPLLNPVLLAVIGVVGMLVFTETSYQSYFEGAQFVHFLL